MMTIVVVAATVVVSVAGLAFAIWTLIDTSRLRDGAALATKRHH